MTGAAGFIGGYVVEELLASGWRVIGLDNFAKYGRIAKSYDGHADYRFHEGDAKNVELLKELLVESDHLLAGAAMIGGIRYFHELAYDLLAENDRIIASTFDAAIHAFQRHRLKKITVVSSSMVFENVTEFPTPEGAQLRSPPPSSTYGFQKLACEYFARGAHQQYGLPFTIARPFNCIGVGEHRARADREVLSGNVRLAMSHVVPDLVQKVLRGQDPLRILGNGSQIRHFTYGGDIARGIRTLIEDSAALNEDFNISTQVSTTVLELAQLIWRKIHPHRPFRFVSEAPYPFDVQRRVPDCRKAKNLLGFEATTSLSEALDIVIPWVRQQIALGKI